MSLFLLAEKHYLILDRVLNGPEQVWIMVIFWCLTLNRGVSSLHQLRTSSCFRAPVGQGSEGELCVLPYLSV